MDITTQFLRYALIGVANTAIHAAVMTALLKSRRTRLAFANTTAFLCAVTFSFFANAYWTFSTSTSWVRYLAFVLFMGCLAYITGLVGDRVRAHPAAVFFIFTGISLVAGFAFSRFVVFGV